MSQRESTQCWYQRGCYLAVISDLTVLEGESAKVQSSVEWHVERSAWEVTRVALTWLFWGWPFLFPPCMLLLPMRWKPRSSWKSWTPGKLLLYWGKVCSREMFSVTQFLVFKIFAYDQGIFWYDLGYFAVLSPKFLFFCCLLLISGYSVS